MSTGALWWYPALSAPLVVLSVRVARLTITPERQGVGAQSLSGRVYHATAGQADRVTLELGAALSLTSDASEATIRDRLSTLEDHLLAGGLVGFSAQASTAWSARIGGVLTSPGDTTFIATNGLPASVAGTLAVGSRLVLRDLSLRERREENTVHAVSGPSVTLVHGITAGLSGGTVARERHTYPALRLAADGRDPMRVDSDGVVYRFSVTLIEDVQTAADTLPQPEVLAARVMAGASPLASLTLSPRGLGSRSWLLP